MVFLPLIINIIPYCHHGMDLDSMVSVGAEAVILYGCSCPCWLKHDLAYQLMISIYCLFVFPVTHSSCLNCIHLQRLIRCQICVVRHKTREILNIVKSAERLLLEEEARRYLVSILLKRAFFLSVFLYFCVFGHWFCMLGCKRAGSVSSISYQRTAVVFIPLN